MKLVLLKPQTYMNRSGLSIRALMDYMKAPVAGRVLVAHDELDSPPGVVRLQVRRAATAATTASATRSRMSRAEFWRLRLGVGHPGDKAQVIDYVLKRAPRAEEDRIVAAIADAADYLPIFVTEGSEKAMNRLHTQKGD